MIKIDLAYFKELFEPKIKQKLEERKIPGFALSIVAHGTRIYSLGFGYSDAEQKKVFNGDTLSRFGSVTKSFTSLAILILEDRGELSVSDPITKYVELHLNTGLNQITIHHLLTHTSGIVDPFMDRNDLSKEEYMNEVSKAINETRENLGKSIYSNIGYSLLSMIIETIMQTSYYKAIRELILQPLKMNRTIFIGEEEENSKDDNLAIPYKPVKENKKIIDVIQADYKYSEFIKGGGAIISSCNEMLLFLDMLMNTGFVNGEQIIEANVIEKMLTGYVKDEPLSKMIQSPAYNGYGFGIKENYKKTGQTFINGAGEILGGTSFVGLFKEAKIGFVCVANSQGFPLLFMYDDWDKVLEHDPVFKNMVKPNK